MTILHIVMMCCIYYSTLNCATMALQMKNANLAEVVGDYSISNSNSETGLKVLITMELST